ncbi:MAG: UDP-N-acetylglucosamine 2-epimerase (non-hydrolyzing) [Chloroflexota bacterium]
MKLATILGTRPEIIRLSRIIPALDQHCEQLLVHTGQNRQPLLRDVFFSELDVRAPDIDLGIEADSFGQQVGQILTETFRLLEREKPDRVLILGDTNSALSAIIACRLGIPVFHAEAGNRCFDDRVPEEVNRRLVDHSSAVLMPYTERSRANLLREGISSDRIFVVGNPINEVLRSHMAGIDSAAVHVRMGLSPGNYFVATTHRQENVDIEWRLRSIVEALVAVARRHDRPVVWSLHPRASSKLAQFGIDVPDELTITEPLGFLDFVALEKAALCTLTDSGTVQEECCIMRVPNVTLRDVTERPETVECGSNILAGVRPVDVLRAVDVALASPPDWNPPPEYQRTDVSHTVARIVLGYSPTTNPREEYGAGG